MSETAVGTALAQKEAAMDFLRLVASGKVREAYRKYVGPGFRHHNPYFRSDADSLMAAMEENAAKNPNKVLEVQRALQDGDLVAVHSHIRQKPGDRGAAVVHIFRFQGTASPSSGTSGKKFRRARPTSWGCSRFGCDLASHPSSHRAGKTPPPHAFGRDPGKSPWRVLTDPPPFATLPP